MKKLLIIALLLVAGCKSANPIPDPVPTPNPSPTPEPTVSTGCHLPSLPDHGDCPVEKKVFFTQNVEDAIDNVIKNHPEYFNLKDDPVGNQPKVLDMPGYVYGVVNALRAQGLCATTDGRMEEIGIKNVNDFNEQFKINRTGDYVRRGRGAYRTTCYPAAF